MRGKYSPTISAAYTVDQEWWHKYSRDAEEFTLYDPEGYDSYGYNEAGHDRAGHQEHEYYCDDIGEGLWDGENFAYSNALDDWGFDGVKPVRRFG
jgi:hypothetical protein